MKFSELFKKYRLKSEISSLSQFGDLMSEEGMVYETSLFTRWQRGDRIPKDRRTLLSMIKVFYKRQGITVDSANKLLEAAGQGYLTESELSALPKHLTNSTFTAPFSSVGELIKNHRIRKDISLEELSLSVGWEDVDNIKQIEGGLIEKPSRKIIDRLCLALKLEKQEKNALLLAGNYMPTREEIAAIQKKVLPEIEKWPYSAVAYDFCWRIIGINSKHKELLDISDTDIQSLHTNNPVALKIVFDPEFMQNKNLTGKDLELWHNNLLRFILHFRSVHKTILRDPWYTQTIGELMNNELFRNLWQRVDNSDVDMLVTRYGKKIFIHPKTKAKLAYNIFVVPLLYDPRFEIEYYSPTNI